MRVVGLTGGIACGKSTVTELLRGRHGLEVVDCDAIAHAVVEKGRWGYRRVVRAFGNAILLPDGSIDRKALADMVFHDAKARRRLNKATHLPVAVELIRHLLSAWLRLRTIVVVDMPLLFETGFDRRCYTTVVVACDEQQQLKRIIARDGGSEAQAAARIAAQMPDAQRRARAGIVLDNRRTREDLAHQVQRAVAALNKGATTKSIITSPYAVCAYGLGLWLLLARGYKMASAKRRA